MNIDPKHPPPMVRNGMMLNILKFVRTFVKTTCFGCLTNQPNQQAHMDENGCMWQSTNMFENMSM